MIQGRQEKSKQRPLRHAVLVVSYDDGFIESFAEKNIDVRFARMPVATSLETQCQAEDVLLDRLPKRYSDLFWPNLRRSSGTTRALYPSTIDDGDYCRAFIKGVNGLPDLSTVAQEAVVWT